jgi:hypothetical protein
MQVEVIDLLDDVRLYVSLVVPISNEFALPAVVLPVLTEDVSNIEERSDISSSFSELRRFRSSKRFLSTLDVTNSSPSFRN